MPESHRFEGREPVMRRGHDRPWIADLEAEKHAENRELLVAEAVGAVEQTGPGTHVDVVTHERHGHPSAYLYDRLVSLPSVEDVSDEGRCGCGGYVTRVHTRRTPVR